MTDLKRIPGPRGLPGGALRMVRFFADPLSFLEKTQASYGDVSAISEGSKKTGFVFGPEHHRHVLTDVDTFRVHALVERAPRHTAMFRLGRHLLGMNGDEHRRARRLMMPAFSKGQVDGYRDAIVQLVDLLVSTWTPGAVVDVERDRQRADLDLSYALAASRHPCRRAGRACTAWW